MKVFVNYNMYDNTPVLIAANTKREAVEVFRDEFGGVSDKFDYNNTYHAKGLDYDTTEPCIINI